MSKMVRGHVVGVADKGTGDKQYAVVGVQIQSVDADGFPVTETVKLMVFGRDFKQGVHNAYRPLVGSEVFAPYRDAGDERGNGVRYFLAGPPVQLQDKVVQQAGPRSAAELSKAAAG